MCIRDRSSPAWRRFVSTQALLLAGAEALPPAARQELRRRAEPRAVVYGAGNGLSAAWYLGKANALRRAGQSAWQSGPVSRLREHTLDTRWYFSTEPRYRAWRETPVHEG
eukprot:3796326-Alexandrium_andersonii.AAC.1